MERPFLPAFTLGQRTEGERGRVPQGVVEGAEQAAHDPLTLPRRRADSMGVVGLRPAWHVCDLQLTVVLLTRSLFDSAGRPELAARLAPALRAPAALRDAGSHPVSTSS